MKSNLYKFDKCLVVWALLSRKTISRLQPISSKSTSPKSQRNFQVIYICVNVLEAESVARNAVDQVRKQQNAVLNAIEGAQMLTLSKGVTHINPAF